MTQTYDRTAEDIGNIVALEHVNICIPDQRLATLFYITALGLTRDPYLVTGVTNMWVNAGRTQFHLPTGAAQQVRGRMGLVVPDRSALVRRLEAAGEDLGDTSFDFSVGQDHVDVVCPWGNRLRCHEPAARFGRVGVGLAYVELDVDEGTAPGIVRFYQDVLGAPAALDGPAAVVAVGAAQQLIFRESTTPQPAYDGHHIQIYVSDFSGPHARLGTRGLITEESDQYQYRFVDIVDPDTEVVLYRLEHEVRSMTHPLYARPLVNRDPERSNRSFAPGYEDRSWSLPPG